MAAKIAAAELSLDCQRILFTTFSGGWLKYANGSGVDMRPAANQLMEDSPKKIIWKIEFKLTARCLS
jgi:hypothetical protein